MSTEKNLSNLVINYDLSALTGLDVQIVEEAK